ncbi:ribonuclease inhibitor [Plantibacter flavus]|uniref:ribonuclease inhibitor n=1 Tax=Plantibacter flavus TaxID=150123 RepID=UPI003F17F397
MTTTLHIDGSRIHDITSLYEVLNDVLMAGEDWRLGESLDALDDALYGGFGALHEAIDPRFVWADAEHSRAALGLHTTTTWLQAKIDHGAPYNVALLTGQLRDLEAGRGKTYFELVLEVFAGHPAIALDLA